MLRLLQDGEIDPQFVVLAAAEVTGELGADIARIGGVDLETVLGDLADLVREAGRAHAEDLPMAGSASAVSDGPGPSREARLGTGTDPNETQER